MTADLPPGAVRLSQRDRLILAHLLTTQRATVDTCSDAVGLGRAGGSVLASLERLRGAGLVSEADGKRGTLRATVEVVG